jgi:transcriptional regulator with XRE-family HTH domain
MPRHHFAARLRELREARGWTQQDLAGRAGVSAISVTRYESGGRVPDFDAVLALAGALGVDCTAFCEQPATRHRKRRPGRPRKDGRRSGLPPAPPAPPPAEDLEGQAEAGPAATMGAKPKRPRARRPRGK